MVEFHRVKTGHFDAVKDGAVVAQIASHKFERFGRVYYATIINEDGSKGDVSDNGTLPATKKWVYARVMQGA